MLAMVVLFLIMLNQVWFIPERAIFAGDFHATRENAKPTRNVRRLRFTVGAIRKNDVNGIASLQGEFQHISAPVMNVRQSQGERPALVLTVLPVSLRRQR
jgi:hypothetical protein